MQQKLDHCRQQVVEGRQRPSIALALTLSLTLNLTAHHEHHSSCGTYPTLALALTLIINHNPRVMHPLPLTLASIAG